MTGSFSPQEIIKKVLKEYSCDSKYNLRSFLEYVIHLNVVNSDFLECINQLEDDEGKALYSQLLDINLSEMKKLISYKEKQTISTQHGVKGEGHSKVCFWSEDSRSTRPYVYMYDFFKMYTDMDRFSLETFQNFYYEYKSKIITLEKKLDKKINNLKSADITEKNIELFDQVLDIFDNNKYFKYIFNDNIQSYKEKRLKNKLPTLKSIQAIFKPDVVNRILIAYKLFYVGCSRAKEELVVLIERDKVSNFEQSFKSKMASIGFYID